MHHDDPTLQQCRALLQTLYGPWLHGVVLYGSCARGTEETDSDIDLMVLLEGPVDSAQEIRRIWAALFPCNWRVRVCCRLCLWMSRSTTGVSMPCIGRRRQRACPYDGVTPRNHRAVAARAGGATGHGHPARGGLPGFCCCAGVLRRLLRRVSPASSGGESVSQPPGSVSPHTPGLCPTRTPASGHGQNTQYISRSAEHR